MSFMSMPIAVGCEYENEVLSQDLWMEVYLNSDSDSDSETQFELQHERKSLRLSTTAPYSA